MELKQNYDYTVPTALFNDQQFNNSKATAVQRPWATDMSHLWCFSAPPSFAMILDYGHAVP